MAAGGNCVDVPTATRTAYQNHGNRRLAQHRARIGAKLTRPAAFVPVRSQHDEIGLPLPGLNDDGIGRRISIGFDQDLFDGNAARCDVSVCSSQYTLGAAAQRRQEASGVLSRPGSVVVQGAGENMYETDLPPVNSCDPYRLGNRSLGRFAAV